MPGRLASCGRGVELPVEAEVLAGLTALADPVRIKIVGLLRAREQCVCHLTEALGLSQGTISHHMSRLKRAGLVRDRRDPLDTRWVYYRIDEAAAAALCLAVDALLDTSAIDWNDTDCCDRGRSAG